MTKIAGFMLSCTDKDRTAAFYAALGLSTNEHRHGNGPLHFEVNQATDQIVFELYNSSAGYKQYAIILFVESIEEALAVVKNFSLETEGEVKKLESQKLLYKYITDPDGRDVMLIQKI